ncbi:nascent polypeptide-associated complex protein [Candidatus Woesearchaeota archaeon]|nr:nascent polypeptide-associated complex protein [Candidatus Woesearchaeota archaeon]
MFPGMNQKMLKDAMKKMGVKQEQIPAVEVIIKTEDGKLLVKEPEVMKVVMMGQESLQITGKMEFVKGVDEGDVHVVQEQTGCSKEEARRALEETDGDIAEAILRLNPDGA